MESKILIDISYSTREPQILINHVDSDDPRDKLISMFTGQAMPGVRDGYCRIERSHTGTAGERIAIMPLDPLEVVKHIPTIKQNALENAVIDKSGIKDIFEQQDLNAVNTMCEQSLSPDIFEKWEAVRDSLKSTRQAFKN